jgi:Na+-transporting methylmalonyl-CoA/oxaloacetate decarboxylase gamma subunit
MQTAIVLAMLTILAQADFIQISPPILGRDALQSNTNHVSAGQNATLLEEKPLLDYNTVEYRAYITFLTLGIVLGILFLPVVLSRSIIRWRRRAQEKSKVKQRNVDVEMATAKMRAMTQPGVVHLRPERAS